MASYIDDDGLKHWHRMASGPASADHPGSRIGSTWRTTAGALYRKTDSATWTQAADTATGTIGSGATTGDTFEINSDGNSVTIDPSGVSGDVDWTVIDASGSVPVFGTVPAADNRLLTADGTAGKIQANSSVTVSDGGAFANVLSITTATGQMLPIYLASKRVQHGDLTAAATSEAIAFTALPAGTKVILGAYASIATLYSGGTVSDLTVDIGFTGGDVNAIVEDIPAFTLDPTGTVYGTDGVLMTGLDNLLRRQTTATALAALVKATGDDVANLDAGDVTFYVLYALVA